MDKQRKSKKLTRPKYKVCRACEGKGISSKGGRCLPCNGIGKLLIKPEYKLSIR